MTKRLLGLVVLTLLLTSVLSAVYVGKPTSAQGDGVLGTDFAGKSLGPTLPMEASEPSAPQDKALEGSEEGSQDYLSNLTIAGVGQFGNWTYLNGNKTRLVVGVDRDRPGRVSELEKVAARYQAKIVNTVSMGGKVRAIVFELFLASVAGFAEEVHAAELATYVEPNMKLQAQYIPNDPYWSVQWGPQKIEADWAWNTTVGDPSILVAVVDTGIYYSHPDIAANYVPLGRDWANNDTDPMDDYGHGTHCAGIIAASIDNNEGIAGLAQVRVMAEKVLDSYGWGYADWVANGIVHATDCGAKIISMSIGGWGDSEVLHEAVKYAYDAGVLLVAAAGNSNSNMKPYPAGYDEIVAVAATDEYDNKAGFSNWGDWIELSAPGVNVYSSVPGGYASMSGTSMACPHVAGVAALLWSQYPNRSRDWVRLWLRYTADDLGAEGFDVNYGYGRVNARKAVQLPPPAHELMAYGWTTPPYVKPGTGATVNATILNFGEDEADVTVQLLANDSVVDSEVIGLLPSSEFVKTSLTWNPIVEGRYNLTFYVVPVLGEANSQNNVLMKNLFVGFPVTAVVLHSAGNVYGDIITNWQALSGEWDLFGDTMVYVDYETLNKEMITYEDIAATEADVLIISCAFDPNAGWQFIDSEIDAITRYVHEGHGLIATAGTLYERVPNNNKLAPLFGINKTNVWWGTYTDLLHVLNETHPFFTDVPNPLVFPQVGTALSYDGRWDSNELVNGEYLALGHYQESAVVAYRGLVYISPFLEIIPPYYHHHLQLLYNAIRWSRYQKPEHELGVTLEAPARLQPGESTLVNATVSNMGLSNETDVTIYLLINDLVFDTTTISVLVNGTSQTLQYLWSPSAEGIYNVTAYTPIVPNESTVTDNAVTRIVRVGYGGGKVVFEEAHLPVYSIGTNPARDVIGGYSEFANYLAWNGYTVSTIDPGTVITSGVLASADVLVIVVPQYSYLVSELDAIEQWIRNGGNLLLISDHTSFGNIARTIAERFQINLRGDMLCDSDENAGAPWWPFYDDGNMMPHTITEGVARIEMYAGDGITSAPADGIPLVKTDSDGTAYWEINGSPALGVPVAIAFEGGTTGCGKLIVTTDCNIWDSANDVDNDGDVGFFDSDNEIFALNIVDWLSVRYQHDLSARLEAPSVAALDRSIRLNATVGNVGRENETDVELRLLINDTIVDSAVVPQLSTGQHYTLSYLWTPMVEDVYNITAYALPVSGEEFTTNNVATSLTSVRPMKYVLFDQTHWTDYIGSYSIWTTSLLQRGYVVEPLTASPVSSDLLENYDVFVIPQANSPYSPDELSAIQTFVVNGGGLLVIGDDNQWIYTTLTEFAGITWAGGGTAGFTTDITPHPVTTGVSSVYLSSPFALMYVSGPAQGLVRDPASNIMLAESEQPGKVLGFADEESLMDYGISQAQNLLLADNMIDWLSVRIPHEHDLSVSLEVPSLLNAGESALVNATVRNRGLNNETAVELQLLVNGTEVNSALIPELPVEASYKLSYVLGPGIQRRAYNVTAYASPVPGESSTLNNLATRIVSVPFYKRTYASPQWIGGGTRMEWHADDSSWEYVLPFDFPFYGVYYRSIWISSNGLITFNYYGDASWGNSITSLSYKLALTPAWNDWVTYYPCDIFTWQNLTHAGIHWYVQAIGSEIVSDFEAILGMDGVIQFNYAYNNGSVSATIGISDGIREILAEDATDLNYINTIIFTPSVPEHELVVSLDAPEALEPYESALLGATVTNRGLNGETDVDLRLLIDDANVAATTIPSLPAGQSYALSYSWTPTAEGIYNVTAYALPVASEEWTENNAATKLVTVRQTRGCVLWDQTHSTDNIWSYSTWASDLINRGYYVETLYSSPLTPSLLEGCDVFVIPQAHSSYTPDELLVIQDFVMGGGGLLVIGDDNPSIYTELTLFAGMNWTIGGVRGTITQDITPHAVTQGVSTIYLPAPFAQINVSSPAIDLVRDELRMVMLAVSETGSGRVLGVVDDDSVMDGPINSADNRRLANNMVDWLMPSEGADVAVTDVTVWPDTVCQGWTVYANVTVANPGSVSETFTVTLYYDSSPIAMQSVYSLQPNATLDLSFSWDTTFVTGQNYTMKAVASAVPGERDTSNNVFVDGLVEVRMLCDITNDGRVDVLDAIQMSTAFGLNSSDPQWNVFCDINQDLIIDILDAILIGNNFGNGY